MSIPIPLFFVIGLWIGGILNAVWYYWWMYVSARRGKPLGKYKWPVLALFEHYHWATILYVVAFRLRLPIVSPILAGVATVFLLDEALAQQHKFAMGSGHFLPSLAIELIILALWLLIELAIAFLNLIIFFP